MDYATISKDMDSVTKTTDGQFEQTDLVTNRKASVFGNPVLKDVTTTTIESHNMQVRNFNRRYARRTMAFSKKFANKCAAHSMFSTYFNFCRIMPAIRCTPAMEAGLTDHIWEIEELIAQIKIDELRANKSIST